MEAENQIINNSSESEYIIEIPADISNTEAFDTSQQILQQWIKADKSSRIAILMVADHSVNNMQSLTFAPNAIYLAQAIITMMVNDEEMAETVIKAAEWYKEHINK